MSKQHKYSQTLMAGMMLVTVLAYNVGAQVPAPSQPKQAGQQVALAAPAPLPGATSDSANPGATNAKAPTAEEFNELRAEMERLRALVEHQQELLAKLSAGGANSAAAATPATQPAVESAATASAPASSPAPAPAQAGTEIDNAEPVKPLRIGGFANWAYGKTNNVNEYDLATHPGRYDNLDTGLIVSLGLTPNVTAVTQFSFQVTDDQTETDVDFAFLNWRLNDKLSLRAGQNKNPYGLYSEYQGIGTQYLFNDTPNSIYGGTGIGNEFYRGIGATGRAFSTRHWEMSYDLFGGARLNDELNPAEQINDAIQAGQPSVNVETQSEDIRQVFGGRVAFYAPENGFRLGFNGNSGMSPDKGRNTVVGSFASFETSKWTLRSEYGYVFEPGFLHKSAAFFEGGYKITEHWQPVFRYDWARMGLNTAVSNLVPEKFKTHREIGVGMNYWINSKAVLKFSYHDVHGNMLSIPRGTLDLATLNDLPVDTKLVTFGLSFVF